MTEPKRNHVLYRFYNDTDSDIAFVVHNLIGPVFACSYHADHYGGKRQEVVWVHGKPKLR